MMSCVEYSVIMCITMYRRRDGRITDTQKVCNIHRNLWPLYCSLPSMEWTRSKGIDVMLFVCVCVCMQAPASMCVCMCNVWACVCMYVCRCVHVYVLVHIHASLYACICVFLYVCKSIAICLHVHHAYTYICTYQVLLHCCYPTVDSLWEDIKAVTAETVLLCM